MRACTSLSTIISFSPERPVDKARRRSSQASFSNWLSCSSVGPPKVEAGTCTVLTAGVLCVSTVVVRETPTDEVALDIAAGGVLFCLQTVS